MSAEQNVQLDGEECKPDGLLSHRWVAVSTAILDHEVVGPSAKTPPPARPDKPAWPPLAAWLWMISEASHQDYKRTLQAQVILLRRGQLVVSERYLADKANWGRKAAKVFMDRLSHFGMIRLSTTSPAPSQGDLFSTQRFTCKTPKRGPSRGPGKGPGLTVVTICNYDKYQHTPEKKGPAKGPSEGPPRGQTLQQIHKEKEDLRASTDHEPKSVTFENGKLALFGKLLSFWLEEFGGDQKALDLALIQAAGFIQPNGPHTLETKVSSQLAKQRRDERNRDKSYQRAAAERKGAAKTAAPNGQLPAWKADINDKLARMRQANERL